MNMTRDELLTQLASDRRLTSDIGRRFDAQDEAERKAAETAQAQVNKCRAARETIQRERLRELAAPEARIAQRERLLREALPVDVTAAVERLDSAIELAREVADPVPSDAAHVRRLIDLRQNATGAYHISAATTGRFAEPAFVA
jgi:hypothetical protein